MQIHYIACNMFLVSVMQMRKPVWQQTLPLVLCRAVLTDSLGVTVQHEHLLQQ